VVVISAPRDAGKKLPCPGPLRIPHATGKARAIASGSPFEPTIAVDRRARGSPPLIGSIGGLQRAVPPTGGVLVEDERGRPNDLTQNVGKVQIQPCTVSLQTHTQSCGGHFFRRLTARSSGPTAVCIAWRGSARRASLAGDVDCRLKMVLTWYEVKEASNWNCSTCPRSLSCSGAAQRDLGGPFRCVTRTNRRSRRLRSGSPISPDPLRVSWSTLSLSPANAAKRNEWVADRDLDATQVCSLSGILL
jgi:hypothetical protein